MKSKSDSVTLTLKKLPPVKGPLNKPLDKPGTPLSEMNVVMDRTKVVPERPARAEMKEAGIKEETSLEMQAIENENAAEENSKVESRIEGIKEEDEGKQVEKENEKSEIENAEEVAKKVKIYIWKTLKNTIDNDQKQNDKKTVRNYCLLLLFVVFFPLSSFFAFPFLSFFVVVYFLCYCFLYCRKMQLSHARKRRKVKKKHLRRKTKLKRNVNHKKKKLKSKNVKRRSWKTMNQGKKAK